MATTKVGKGRKSVKNTRSRSTHKNNIKLTTEEHEQVKSKDQNLNRLKLSLADNVVRTKRLNDELGNVEKEKNELSVMIEQLSTDMVGLAKTIASNHGIDVSVGGSWSIDINTGEIIKQSS